MGTLWARSSLPSRNRGQDGVSAGSSSQQGGLRVRSPSPTEATIVPCSPVLTRPSLPWRPWNHRGTRLLPPHTCPFPSPPLLPSQCALLPSPQLPPVEALDSNTLTSSAPGGTHPHQSRIPGEGVDSQLPWSQGPGTQKVPASRAPPQVHEGEGDGLSSQKGTFTVTQGRPDPGAREGWLQSPSGAGAECKVTQAPGFWHGGCGEGRCQHPPLSCPQSPGHWASLLRPLPSPPNQPRLLPAGPLSTGPGPFHHGPPTLCLSDSLSLLPASHRGSHNPGAELGIPAGGPVCPIGSPHPVRRIPGEGVDSELPSRGPGAAPKCPEVTQLPGLGEQGPRVTRAGSDSKFSICELDFCHSSKILCPDRYRG